MFVTQYNLFGCAVTQSVLRMNLAVAHLDSVQHHAGFPTCHNFSSSPITLLAVKVSFKRHVSCIMLKTKRKDHHEEEMIYKEKSSDKQKRSAPLLRLGSKETQKSAKDGVDICRSPKRNLNLVGLHDALTPYKVGQPIRFSSTRSSPMTKDNNGCVV